MTETFTFGGAEYTYFDHPYNTTALNERAVEIPIAAAFIAGHGIDLEIGNVLNHYQGVAPPHRVVDRFEVADGVENIDVFDIDGKYDSIVAISTLEHVRWDEPDRDPLGSFRALSHLCGLLNRGGGLFVTVPAGHHPALDEFLSSNAHCAWSLSTMVRCFGGWVETVSPHPAPYGATTRWAESVWIGAW